MGSEALRASENSEAGVGRAGESGREVVLSQPGEIGPRREKEMKTLCLPYLSVISPLPAPYLCFSCFS